MGETLYVTLWECFQSAVAVAKAAEAQFADGLTVKAQRGGPRLTPAFAAWNAAMGNAARFARILHQLNIGVDSDEELARLLSEQMTERFGNGPDNFVSQLPRGPKGRRAGQLSRHRASALEHPASLIELRLRDLTSGEALRQNFQSIGPTSLLLSFRLAGAEVSSCEEDHQRHHS